jgi:predicted anti-sigma-YlaC factor YlaD
MVGVRVTEGATVDVAVSVNVGVALGVMVLVAIGVYVLEGVIVLVGRTFAVGIGVRAASCDLQPDANKINAPIIRVQNLINKSRLIGSLFVLIPLLIP